MIDEPPTVLRFTLRPASWAQRAAFAAWVVFVLALAALLIVPVLVIGAAAFLALVAWVVLRRIVARHDGRRNVRVVAPDERS